MGSFVATEVIVKRLVMIGRWLRCQTYAIPAAKIQNRGQNGLSHLIRPSANSPWASLIVVVYICTFIWP